MRLIRRPQNTLNRVIQKQPMFQQRLADAPPGFTTWATVSGSLFGRFFCPRSAQTACDVASASDFSYASEILEKPASPVTEVSGAKNKDARVRASQNRTEIPPRSDLPFGPTSRIVSPFVVVVCTSRRLRASTMACARKGRPKVGKSWVT